MTDVLQDQQFPDSPERMNRPEQVREIQAHENVFQRPNET